MENPMLKPIILALTLLATPLAAETEGHPCEMLGGLAAQIMEARQVGVPLSDMMRISADSELIQALTISAYQSPRFSTDAYRQEAITDFRNEVEVMCYSSTT
jgi:hypothetical protein